MVAVKALGVDVLSDYYSIRFQIQLQLTPLVKEWAEEAEDQEKMKKRIRKIGNSLLLETKRREVSRRRCHIL